CKHVCVTTGDPRSADHVRAGTRSGRRRHRPEHGAPRPQCNRIYSVRIWRSAKWLELLKEIAPRVTRAAVVWEPAIPTGTGQLGAIQSVAPSFGVELSPVDVRDVREIEGTVAAFARGSNGGLIVTASALAVVHREVIITLATRYKLPAVFFLRSF